MHVQIKTSGLSAVISTVFDPQGNFHYQFQNMTAKYS